MRIPKFVPLLFLFAASLAIAVRSRGDDLGRDAAKSNSPAPQDPVAPVKFFSIDDPQMNEWAQQSHPKLVLTGRILHLPPEEFSKTSISYTLNVLGSESQIKKPCVLEADGTFRLELESIFPWQHLFLNITPFYTGTILLNRDLHIEIDWEKLPERKSEEMKGLLYSGSDGALNEEVNRFYYFFQSARRAKINQAMSKTKAGGPEDYIARLATLAELKHENEELIRAFSPHVAGAYLQNESDARYYAAVLEMARNAKHPLEDEPIWQEIIHHPTYVVSSGQRSFFNSLHFYITATHLPRQINMLESLPPASDVADAAPDVQEAYRVATALAASQKDPSQPAPPELQASVETLRKAGLLSASVAMLKRVNDAMQNRIPTAKLDLSNLEFIPKEPMEARFVITQLRRSASEPWIRSYLDRASARQQARLEAINSTLAQARSGVKSDPLGQPMLELPTGAKLYHLPALSGRELLARLSQAFPGKALILDFWGPWCSPCLTDLPHSKKAHDALKDEAVEFVYFGSRTVEGPWKRTIAELGLSGTHILLEMNQVDELMAFFGGKGFPSYVFIDRKGQVKPGAITWFAKTSADDIRPLLQ